ncbi:hypothetical protein ACRQ5Q_22570 [Bradyrhizobium sp. PMVTL-01]|uniref:hypothetical protein n=1 Tax=Bradyrhizobium sp. PMVTL-01 TaxID=3434999 RepID=UPI003F71DF33
MSIIHRLPQYQTDPRADQAAFTKEFAGTPGVAFSALTEAQAYLKERGFSFGQLCVPSPIGVMHGRCAIPKWRHLTPDEIDMLHGTLTGDHRNGPVKLSLFWSAPSVAIAKVASPGYALAVSMLEGAAR